MTQEILDIPQKKSVLLLPRDSFFFDFKDFCSPHLVRSATCCAHAYKFWLGVVSIVRSPRDASQAVVASKGNQSVWVLFALRWRTQFIVCIFFGYFTRSICSHIVMSITCLLTDGWLQSRGNEDVGAMPNRVGSRPDSHYIDNLNCWGHCYT